MKLSTLILAGCFLLIGTSLTAQKFAYIDSDYVLSHMPEYATAQSELNGFSSTWQEEIEAKYESIARLEAAYRAEKVLLTDEMKKRREEELVRKKIEATELQKKKFGVEGELFQKREELIQPVQEMMYEAIKDVASASGYMVIFDIKNNSNMLYSNPKYNVSDKVIKKMGYKPGETIEEEKPEDDKGNSKSGASSPKGAQGTKTNSKGQQSRGGSLPTTGKK